MNKSRDTHTRAAHTSMLQWSALKLAWCRNDGPNYTDITQRAVCRVVVTITNLLKNNGAQGRDRTTDTVIFSHVLYQLSYLGAHSGRRSLRGERLP